MAVSDIASVSRGHSGTDSHGLGVMGDRAGSQIIRMYGDNATAVHIHKKDGTKLVLVTKENDAVFAAVSEALARRDAKLPRVRVEAPSEEASEDAADAEGQTTQKKARIAGEHS
ncbi:MAG: hypothetical protein J0L92_18010 [Deltaproteobacteria bacterium]|nr:hypothetical protein [Deltaproteobacteria bacterium]